MFLSECLIVEAMLPERGSERLIGWTSWLGRKKKKGNHFQGIHTKSHRNKRSTDAEKSRFEGPHAVLPDMLTILVSIPFPRNLSLCSNCTKRVLIFFCFVNTARKNRFPKKMLPKKDSSREHHFGTKFHTPGLIQILRKVQAYSKLVCVCVSPFFLSSLFFQILRNAKMVFLPTVFLHHIFLFDMMYSVQS